MKQILALFFAVAVLSGCSTSPKNSSKHSPEDSSKQPESEKVQPIDSHTSRTSLNYQGVYKGTVPCADCEGIQTVITLGENDFTLETVYLGKDKTVYKESGVYSWNDDGQRITLEGVKNAPNQYFVGENRLYQLDMEGNWITGKFADNYALIKTD
ncbi:copper resistance protein [Bacteroidia bacterium]|nr:copper resistance protein [Bacteroidia bacterium]